MSASEEQLDRVRESWQPLESAGYYPVGTAFTWGTRVVAYVVTDHKVDGRYIWHACDEWLCDERRASGYGALSYTSADITRYARDTGGLIRPSLGELWAALDGTEGEEEELS